MTTFYYDAPGFKANCKTIKVKTVVDSPSQIPVGPLPRDPIVDRVEEFLASCSDENVCPPPITPGSVDIIEDWFDISERPSPSTPWVDPAGISVASVSLPGRLLRGIRGARLRRALVGARASAEPGAGNGGVIGTGGLGSDKRREANARLAPTVLAVRDEYRAKHPLPKRTEANRAVVYRQISRLLENKGTYPLLRSSDYADVAAKATCLAFVPRDADVEGEMLFAEPEVRAQVDLMKPVTGLIDRVWAWWKGHAPRITFEAE